MTPTCSNRVALISGGPSLQLPHPGTMQNPKNMLQQFATDKRSELWNLQHHQTVRPVTDMHHQCSSDNSCAITTPSTQSYIAACHQHLHTCRPHNRCAIATSSRLSYSKICKEHGVPISSQRPLRNRKMFYTTSFCDEETTKCTRVVTVLRPLRTIEMFYTITFATCNKRTDKCRPDNQCTIQTSHIQSLTVRFSANMSHLCRRDITANCKMFNKTPLCNQNQTCRTNFVLTTTANRKICHIPLCVLSPTCRPV